MDRIDPTLPSAAIALDDGETEFVHSTERAGTSGLRRDLELLQALAGEEAHQRGGLGVVRLAEMLQREKSQVSRALRALEQVGLVERDPATREYRLGWQLFGLAARVSDTRLLQTAPPIMRALVEQLGESAHLCVLQANQVVTVHTEAPTHAFRATGWVGRTFPAYCSSSGRALLVDCARDELARRFLRITFEPYGPVQLVHNVAELYQQVVLVRQLGYAAVSEEFEPELVGVSAPVRDFRGRVVAALNVSAPKFRMGATLESAGRAACEAAVQLSARMGWERTKLDT